MPRVRATTWNRLRYTIYAPFYDLALERLSLFRRGRRRSIELAALRPGERVLLVAAGTGLDLEYLPDFVDVIATDLTPAIVARLRARAEALRAEGRRMHVEAEVMDAARLTLAEASVDVVLCHLALAVVPDPDAVLREVMRVLRPNGRVMVFDQFLPDGERPSLARRVAGSVARVLATDVNRQLGPLLSTAGLRDTAREAVGPAGMFVVARAERPMPGG